MEPEPELLPRPVPCYQTQRAYETWRQCARQARPVHIPTGFTGLYCGVCCPGCHPKPDRSALK